MKTGLSSYLNRGACWLINAVEIGVSEGLGFHREEYSRRYTPGRFWRVLSSNGSLEDRMAQHAWATERLWEALYVSSLDVWTSVLTSWATSRFPMKFWNKREKAR